MGIRGIKAATVLAVALAMGVGFAGQASAQDVGAIEGLVVKSGKGGRWLKAESPRFTIYSNGDEGVLRDYVAKLELFDSWLRFRHGLPIDGVPPRKLTLYLVGNTSEFKIVWPTVGSGVQGFYKADVDEIFAMAVRQRADDHVIQHEYVHHFMMQYFPYGYPSWLVEGYAEYFGSATIVGKKIEAGRNETRGENVVYGPWVSMDKLLSKRPFELGDSESASMFYAQAWLLTHYFISDPNRYQQLVAYMKAVGAGADPVTSMEKVTGLTASQLQIKLRAYSTSAIPYKSFTATDLPTPRIEISRLSPTADDLLLAELSLRAAGLEAGRDAPVDADDEDEPGKGEPGKDKSGKDAKEKAELAKAMAEGRAERQKWREELLGKVRAAATRYPDQRLPKLALARAELTFGDFGKGLALIDQYTVDYPEDAVGFELAGLARLQAGDDAPERKTELYKAAGAQFGKAFKLDGGRYQTLYGYARSRTVEAHYPSENVLTVLDKAHRLAPQVETITLTEARALIMKHEYVEADALLRPVAGDPHKAGSAAAAQRLLKEIADKLPKTAEAAGGK
ncbi:tetratricopeptide repeat protein [Caulobacter hibisci]|uniref:DUF1570 domain-containing protein n=1 Tax=Caulobacter hibisci TaxID=2035993 RepID=A0ABS0T3S3_9CAUL|nr:hypothetical protein [Caulobacter hibisci]MBI1686528.1 hypothetical protein [Caulobacter hibisci]